MTPPDNLLAEAGEMLAAQWDAQDRPQLAKSIRNGREDEWSKAGPAVAAIAQALKRAQDAERERDEALDKLRIHAGGHIKSINSELTATQSNERLAAALEEIADGLPRERSTRRFSRARDIARSALAEEAGRG